MTLAKNIQHYPEWAVYLKDLQPKQLLVWGRNDPLFLPAAAEVVKRLVPATCAILTAITSCSTSTRRDSLGDHRDVLSIGKTQHFMRRTL
jgi:hypothetical protein